MGDEREFQVIVYGATGFTGRLVSDVLYHKKTVKYLLHIVLGVVFLMAESDLLSFSLFPGG